jgi:opacity protein-like surface antigen
MKKIAGAALAVLFTAGLAAAQDTTTPVQSPGMSQHHKVITADVVSVDAQAKTITFKRSDGTSATSSGQAGQQTLSVDAAALSSLSGLSAGDRVKLVCKEDSSGTQRVTRITRASDTRPATDQPPSKEPPPRH